MGERELNELKDYCKEIQELQDQGDIEKYERGFVNNCDNSGMMKWCSFCEYRKGTYGCNVSHEERRSKCLCGKAYKDMMERWN